MQCTIKQRVLRLTCGLLAAAILAGCTARQQDTTGVSGDDPIQSGEMTEPVSKNYRLWYDEAALQNMEGFERQSLPLGNGYMGINVFGGVNTELISITENSMCNPYTTCKGGKGPFDQERMEASAGGLNLLSKTYIDFDHKQESNYTRELRLNDAVANVRYDCDGVTYTRTYFTSYPDKVAVVRLSASEAGALSFTLRPETTHCYPYLEYEGDGMGKLGSVSAKNDTIQVSGIMEHFNIRYEGLFRVIPQGGTMQANEKGKGTITVTNADSAVILIAVGTNYHLTPEVFTAIRAEKLDPNEDPHEKVLGYLNAAAEKTYEQLLEAHRADYTELFDRAELDLGGVLSDTVPTDQLLNNYKNGTYDPYLEELVFQYGRYLLIASSREGTLPANLQGIWNFGDSAAWSGGYWHNINVQMNYWPAFSTGLAELFKSYVDYNEAFRSAAQQNADNYVDSIGAPTIAAAGTGENGWAIGTGLSPYTCTAPTPGSHSGPGTGSFTSLLFWDYYDYTRDETILKEHTYPAVEGMAKFLSKTLQEYEDGKWLVYKSASPENFNGYGENGQYLYHKTVGTAFDQQMVYANHLVTLQAAQLLGYTEETHPILATIKEQIDHLDPVNVGYSGQVKEYREEHYYSEFGEPNHRHISQLVGLYPATVINENTQAWLDAAAVSLNLRGDSRYGWSKAHRLLCWARIQDAQRSYGLLQGLLKENTAANLWGVYDAIPGNNDPFQIDGNFGYTAAVAEMLLQSHAGYLDLLPALPAEWKNGSFDRLTTRGNFAVDAAWTDGCATSFAIHSGSGGQCTLHYPKIAGAKILDSKGNAVSFITEAEDKVSFETEQGETYMVTDIPAHENNLDAPTNLKLAIAGNAIDLTWETSANAVGYNVYRAINDAPSYELMASGVTDTTYSYVPEDVLDTDQLTLRVTAVAADGTESAGVTQVRIPKR